LVRADVKLDIEERLRMKVRACYYGLKMSVELFLNSGTEVHSFNIALGCFTATYILASDAK